MHLWIDDDLGGVVFDTSRESSRQSSCRQKNHKAIPYVGPSGPRTRGGDSAAPSRPSCLGRGSTAPSTERGPHSTSSRTSRRSAPDTLRCGTYVWPSGPRWLSPRINGN